MARIRVDPMELPADLTGEDDWLQGMVEAVVRDKIRTSKYESIGVFRPDLVLLLIHKR